jgi:hypothetical protein
LCPQGCGISSAGPAPGGQQGQGGDPCGPGAPCPAPLRSRPTPCCPHHLEYCVHDTAERAASGIIRHAKDVQTPLAQVLQLLVEMEVRGQKQPWPMGPGDPLLAAWSPGLKESTLLLMECAHQCKI